MKLREICHARSGDKGNDVNVGVRAYEPAFYPWLVERLTSEAVATHFGDRVRGPVRRYELPLIGALNFVLHGALDGGATRSRWADAYGKSFGAILLELDMGGGPEPPSAAADDVPHEDGVGFEGRLRLGCGSGFGTDYLEGAIDLVEEGSLDYLIFDWISERTLIEASRAKAAGGDGYDPNMETRVRALVPRCAEKGTKIIANWGGADVEAAARRLKALTRELGLRKLKIAYVAGSDVLMLAQTISSVCAETETPIGAFGDALVAAHVYHGARPIVEALELGADIVVSGRVGDAAQYLAPMMYEFGWADDDWNRIGKGLGVGHIMECGPQVTGGYFADPGVKDVKGLARAGLPVAEVGENGDAIITKLSSAGGMVSVATCAEQIIYEIGDPSYYYHADGIVDFTATEVHEVGKDRVLICGTKGKEKPSALKVALGVREGFAATFEMIYAGTGAYEKAKMAADVVVTRLSALAQVSRRQLEEDLTISYVGVNSIFEWGESGAEALREVGLRVSGRFATRAEAQQLVDVMFALSAAGPSGVSLGRETGMGGVEEITGLYTSYLPRSAVTFDVRFA